VPALYEHSHPIKSEIGRRTEALKKEARARVELAARKHGIAFKKAFVIEGSPARTIVETAEKERVDLVVMGKKGQSGLEKILVGSVANHVLRHSPVPVLVTQKKKTLAIRKILVPTDFAKGEDVERDYAWQLAKGFGASLTFLYVLELYGQFAMVDEMFQSVREIQRRAEKMKKGVDDHADLAINAALYRRLFTAPLRPHAATCAGGLSRFFLGATPKRLFLIPTFRFWPCRRNTAPERDSGLIYSFARSRGRRSW
jgi:nucleotide-binding universal stress UspA family protein